VIGVGLDVVDIERFREVLTRRPAMHQRLFTDGERALAAGRTDPVPALAVRFAAKEAVMKALGVGLGAFSSRRRGGAGGGRAGAAGHRRGRGAGRARA
jgi:holo-[acyl-carrier protein] synthase